MVKQLAAFMLCAATHAAVLTFDNPGFEETDHHWSLSYGAAVVPQPQTGRYSVCLSPGASATQEVSVPTDGLWSIVWWDCPPDRYAFASEWVFRESTVFLGRGIYDLSLFNQSSDARLIDNVGVLTIPEVPSSAVLGIGLLALAAARRLRD